MNSNGTTYQNGRFVDVDEVHNNTKNMTLSGFNQEGGKVTGNIQNLTIESKQNTSTTKGSTTGGSLSIAPNGLPSGSASYSQTNGERRVVDSPTTFIIGDGSNLKVGKVENTAGAIGATGSGKLSIDEYIGHNLENVDKLKTVGGSVGVSTSGITSLGVNYSDRKQEGITKNTVIGNVEIGKSSGAEINKDLGSMTEITKDRDFKTDINIESQTIKYALNPSQFKEDLQIALIEGKATGRTVVKTIDNMINGDKSQDIGDAEKRSLIEIKEAIVRVQTAPAMDIIAEKDLADKNIQARLGVEIEKFDPNDPTLSEKVKERLDELKAEGKEIVAFYDKKTGKIFINQNAKDDEVRASIAREYKIKEDLELGRGKENDKGQLRSTVAGEIAYDEIKDRLKKGDKNPISVSRFDVAKMDKDSEVTSDVITKEDREFIKYYKREVLPNDPNYKIVRRIMSTGYNMIPGIGQAKLVLEVLVGEDLVTGDKYDITDTISTSFMVQKSIAEQRLSQMKNLSGREKIEYLMKNQNIVSENSPKLVEYKNNGMITNNQLLLEYKPIKMLPEPYKDLTVSQNLTGLDSSTTNNSLIVVNKTNPMPPVLYKAENTALVLYKSPNGLSTPVATSRVLTTTPLLITDGANKVNQVQNKFFPYNSKLALPVKYPIVTKSGVTLYKGYAIGKRGAKYTEVEVSINKEIVYRNNSGSYFKLTDKGLEDISSKDVIKKEYFPTVKVQKNNGSNPSAGKDYYVSKGGNFKVKKYIEAGQTVEDYDKKYLVENARARGINVGRSKEHTNTTLGHWEKAVDIADEAKEDSNVKAVYVDEALRNISDKFKDDKTIPDVTIEYNDETFKLIEVQSKTDTEKDLRNKLKNIQNKYGKDIVKEYNVEEPKGGK